jgi:uncharacterized protein
MLEPSLPKLSTQPTNDFLQLACDRLSKYLDRHAQDLNTAEISRLKALQTKLEQTQIDLAVFGLVSRGKTAMIEALLGKKIGATGAIHGITQVPQAVEFDLRGHSPVETALGDSRGDAYRRRQKAQLRLIDTPGLDEVDGKEKGELAKVSAQEADLILFVIAGDMTRLEQEMLSELSLAYKPILLVFNKVDLYPECDRLAIHQALQDEQLQNLISVDEIILTASAPLPTRVRLEYAGVQGVQSATEIWEPQPPQVQALKQKILDLLNQEGKALLAINVLRALAQIQDEVIDRQLQKMPRLRSLAAFVFVIEAIALGVSPSFWLDAVISAAINLLVALAWMRKLPSLKSQLWLSAILGNALLTAAWGLEAQLTQIAWVAIAIPFMIQKLQSDVRRSSGWGKSGARSLMQDILQQLPTNSILSRIGLVLRSSVGTK